MAAPTTNNPCARLAESFARADAYFDKTNSGIFRDSKEQVYASALVVEVYNKYIAAGCNGAGVSKTSLDRARSFHQQMIMAKNDADGTTSTHRM